MSESTERWMAFASEDLQMAEFALGAKIYNQACFHSQQCVEKVLKGLLAELGRTIPGTHSITDLLQKLPQDWFVDFCDDLAMLDDFYIPARYPDALPGSLPEGLPGQTDATQTMALARSVMEEARRLIQSRPE
jgi:HEPN domain-containing protein